MRGARIHEEVFAQELPRGQKGQRNEYLEERDALLVHRYFYYGHLRRMKLEECLLHLHREFFLTPDYLTRRILNNRPLLDTLRTKPPGLQELRRMYPWMVW